MTTLVRPQRDSTDPVFIAQLKGGHQTCTAVFCSPKNLDPARGVSPAHRAYRSLLVSTLKSIEIKQAAGEIALDDASAITQRLSESLKPQPKIIAARFEFDGAVLRSYDAGALAGLPDGAAA